MARTERGAELDVVVDLSVADDHASAVLVEHWLVASHQTDDGESTHTDHDPVVLVPAHAVGTTMPHALQRRTDIVGTIGRVGADEPGDPTHVVAPASRQLLTSGRARHRPINGAIPSSSGVIGWRPWS